MDLVNGKNAQLSAKFVRTWSTAENIFDAERHVLSKNWNGTMKRSVIKETHANVTVRQK